jgi:hypothetical protein
MPRSFMLTRGSVLLASCPALGACLCVLSLLGCRTPEPPAHGEPLLWSLAQSAPAPARTAAEPAPPEPAAPREPPAPSSPFFPVIGEDGAPSTTEFQLSPVMGATFLLTQGYPAWRIGRLEGDAIVYDALPTRGLPEMCVWDSVIGRYPDVLWIRVPSYDGGLDYYRWQPSARAWSLDKTLRQRRRTALDIGPWSNDRLLVVLVDPVSLTGEPASSTWRTFPDRRIPRLPKLPRPDPCSVVSTRAEELVVAYSEPAEVAVLEAGASAFRRFTLPVTGTPFVTQLVFRSIHEMYVGLADTDRDHVLGFDGEHWTEMALPAPMSIQSLVATSDGTLWLLDRDARIYRRGAGQVWQSIAAPRGASVPAALIVSEEPGRLWLQIGPETGAGIEKLWTLGEVRERTSPTRE